MRPVEFTSGSEPAPCPAIVGHPEQLLPLPSGDLVNDQNAAIADQEPEAGLGVCPRTASAACEPLKAWDEVNMLPHRVFAFALATLLVAGSGVCHSAIIVHTTDFILDASRTQFNGFESIPNNGTFYNTPAAPYTEDGITVQQMNGNPGFGSIWVTHPLIGRQGQYVWYPNGGDNGYTSLSLLGGADFQSVGFNYGSPYQTTKILYELLNDGGVVLSGSALMAGASANYLGFSGGGFDSVRVRQAMLDDTGTVTDGTLQALAIDNVETHDVGAVPEPSSLVLFAAGALLGCVSYRRRSTSP
jgi:hypothetical protein